MRAIVAALPHDLLPRAPRQLVGRRCWAPARSRAPALTAYAAWEARAVHPAPGRACRCCRAGHRPLRVLHLSDLHMTPGPDAASRSGCAGWPTSARPGGQHRRQPGAPALGAGGARRARPAARRARASSSSAPTTTTRPTLRNPLRYLLPDDGQPQHAHAAAAVARPARRVHRRRLARPDQHAATALKVGGTTFAFAGVDDPHLRVRPARRGRRPGRRRTPTSGSASRTRRTCGCSTSSPPTATTRSSPATPTAARSACPGVGALTTNCDLDPPAPRGCTGTRRTRARATRAPPGCTSRPGLGTSPYARIRVACRPEATLLTPDAAAPT